MPRDAGGAARVAHERVLEREVDDVRDRAVADERRELDAVGEEHLAEDLEVLHAGGTRGREDLRRPDARRTRGRRAWPCRRGTRPPRTGGSSSPKTSARPFTTNGCSVKMSSSPKKSPCSKHAGEQLSNVMSPRLWYRVTSLSQAGRLTFRFCGSDERLARLVLGREAREARAARVRAARRTACPCSRGTGPRRRREGRAAGEEDHVGRVVDDDVEVDLQPERCARSRRTPRSRRSCRDAGRPS